MYRLFIAIDPPAEIRSQIISICHGLEGVKWEPENQIHLTLRFIGDVDGLMLNEICNSLSGIKENSFSLKLNGLGHFPHRGSPKVLWARVDNKSGPANLYRIINRVLIKCGVEEEHRKFSPHITLGRVKTGSSYKIAEYLSYHALFRTESFTVTRFHLYSSNLTPKGAIHEKLASFNLN